MSDDVILWLGMYQILWWLLRGALAVFARLWPRLRVQLSDRSLSAEQLQAWRQQRDARRLCVFFLCSSAGEYEQAKPLASRWAKDQQAFVLFILISASGIRFAETQQEQEPYLKAPWDQPLAWFRLFRALRPNHCFVVRYELWPGFLAVARRWAPVYLIDAVQSASLRRSPLGRWIWRRLLLGIRHVFVVGDEDRVFYTATLGVPAGKISLVGDSKYDRVLERLEEREPRRRQMEGDLASFLADRRVIILGSAWPKDLEALLAVYPRMRQEDPRLRLIVAPHDVSAAMVQAMKAALHGQGLRVCQVSVGGMAAASEGDDVLLVDRIGLLPELYALAHVAWVGGGMHHRVHNVLEPACRGIYIGFGPRYHTSQEAVWLVQERLAQVITDGPGFYAWYQTLNWTVHPPHAALWRAVQSQKGASERILQEVLASGSSHRT